MFALSLNVCLSLVFNAARDDFPKVPGALVFSGTHSQIKTESIRLIRTAAEWEKTWKEHRGDAGESQFTESWQEIEVDFNTHCVVAIFVGGWDECTASPVLRDGSVVVRFAAIGYSTEGRQFGVPTAEEKFAEAKGRAKKPYAFVILPKAEKPIVVEEGKRRGFPRSYVWLPRVTFPAPPAKK